MKAIFLKPYNPSEHEEKIYKKWETSGFFNPDICINKSICNEKSDTFSIVLPPPNVTGTLHTGHSLMLAVEDILIRFNRMRGKKTLWIPGTDHAAIATESKVEDILYKKENKTRHDLGKEKFLEKVRAFAKESHDTIINQVKKIGSSLDWSREAYTLDKKRSEAVNTAFKKMYNAGLIYRGERIVNWDPKMGSNVSDDEIEWIEETTNFYYIKYGPFTIGTARPETKFGDKYVVMHPDDKRYKKYKHGEKIEVEWINGKLTATIIKDEAVDMDFGTGVMTITPWHDQTDFEIAQRHNLDKEQIIDKKGLLLDVAGEKFRGMHIKKARPLIIEELKKRGLLEKVDKNYTHRIATNYRGGGIIEPQIMKQWFVGVDIPFVIEKSNIKGVKSGSKATLKELMINAVKKENIKILPRRFEKTYFHWIENLHDWCISRQIWFGHQMPVWYRLNSDMYETYEKNPNAFENTLRTLGNEPIVSIKKPKGKNWVQDPDTLDTWFSSGLWTFSTLGWPENTKDLKTYHPTNVLETGYDILFFWVARMILMSGFLLGDVPFRVVYLHGLVRDKQGRKMSKSLGNSAIDPLSVIEKYGADALRMALIVGIGAGSDSNLSEEKIRAYKKFGNKLWNIARFVLSNTKDYEFNKKTPLGKNDKKELKKLNALVKELTADLENYRLYLGAEKIYHYIWHHFADVVLEESKTVFETGGEEEILSKRYLLLELLATSLRLLHPFMPFITEVIWQNLPKEIKDQDILMVSKWPSGELDD